jgi:hypothetical protein
MSMWMKLSGGLLMVSFLGPLAFAGNPVERARDRVELADDRRALADDRVDFHRLNTLVEDWHKARLNRDKALERRADKGLSAWVRQEVVESRQEVAEARAEVSASKREAHRDPLRDKRDDAGDLRDDRKDLARERVDTERTLAIAKQLKAMQPRFTDNSAGAPLYEKKSALLRELQRLAAQEIAKDQAEIREDRRELHEDRRRR